MKGFKGIIERIWTGSIEEVKKSTAKIVRREFFHERPAAVTFERLVKYHDLTPQIMVAVGSYSELITGTDLIVNTKNQEAQDFLEEWIRKTGFYDKFEGLVTTILITGNGLLEKLSASNIEDVSEVDMTSIISKKRDEFGELEFYEQRQVGGKIVRLENIEQFIEFNLTMYSRQAWGRSLFYSLAVPRTTGFRTTPPLVETMWATEDAMAGIITNNAYPITTITYPGANDEYLEKEAERWRKYKPGDKRVQKIKPEIEFFETAAQSKYTDYIQHLEKVVELGTQFPHDILTGDFTSRASSETTETIVMKKVRGYQRYLCMKLKKELFEPLLEQNGFNTEEVELELSFTTQNIVELEPEKVLELFKVKAITLKELRSWYQENTGMELDEKEMLDLIAQKDADQQMQQDVMMNKNNQFNQKQNQKKLDKQETFHRQHVVEQQKEIKALQEKLRLRESANKNDKAKLTREILEMMKEL